MAAPDDHKPDDVAWLVRSVMAQAAGVAPESLSPASHLQADLRLDSLEFLQVLQQLDQRLGVDLDATEAAALSTFGDIQGLVLRKVAEAGRARHAE